MDYLCETERGYVEDNEGIRFLMDPETFVDPGIILSNKIRQAKDEKGHEVIVWRHFNTSKSHEYYYLWQSYWKRPKGEIDIVFEHDTRAFSFHGLYRKYSETDLFEAIRIKN